MDILDAANRLAKENGFRDDLVALARFVEDANDYELESESPVNLFWRIYKTNSAKGPLPANVEREVLGILDEIEKEVRIAYEPDLDVTEPEVFLYAHVAMSKAIILKNSQGYSEDVRGLLNDVLRVLQLGCGPVINGMFEINTEPSSRVLALSVNGLVAVLRMELFEITNSDGDYEKALEYYAYGISLAMEATKQAIHWHYGNGWNTDSYPEERLGIMGYLLDGSVQLKSIEVDELDFVPRLKWHDWEGFFEEIKSSNKVSDWSKVHQYCEMLSRCNFDIGFSDEYGRDHTFASFWAEASAFAKARLQPSELLEEMKKAESERAEKRLKAYFFKPELWEALPERTKGSLINADLTWFTISHGRYGNLGSVLIETQIAVESLLFTIWQELQNQRKSIHSKRTASSIDRKEHEPGLGNFAYMLEGEAFVDWVRSRKLDSQEIEFLSIRLPSKLRCLINARNDIVHRFSESQPAEEIASIYKQFLGIGYEGIIPRLAGILRKCSMLDERFSTITPR